MEHDYPEQPGWVRLPGYDEDPRYPHGADGPRDYRRAVPAGPESAGRARRPTGQRRCSSPVWPPATGYFAHHAPAATPATSAVTSVPGGTAATGAHKPSLSAPVATSSGSGVTVRTGPGGTRIVSYRDN